MHDLIVVAGYTSREHLMDEFESQLRSAKIDFHFEEVAAMPDGPNSMTMARKIDFARKMAMKFFEYDKIVFADAFDVLCYGTAKEIAANIPRLMTFSAERNCYPEPDLASRFSSISPWRYANAGLSGGAPENVIAWCDTACHEREQGILDQAWLNRRRAEESDLIRLDEWTDVFYTVSHGGEDGSLQLKDGKPWNSRCNTYPNFFHFSGRSSTEGFRNLLVDGGQLR